MPSAVLRFDASPTIGAGHAMRSLVLADALAANGWAVSLAVTDETLEAVPACEARGLGIIKLDSVTWNVPGVLADNVPGGCDVLVVDHYELDAVYEGALRGWAKLILVIDDLADRPHAADALLDQTAGREALDYSGLVSDECTFLLGSDYALIRADFAAQRESALAKREKTAKIEKVLVSFGYTDPTNATAQALQALQGGDVTVAIGSSAPHLAEVQTLAAMIDARVILDADDMPALMLDADLGVGAAGSTSWERACLGLPSIAVITGDDQVHVAAALQDAGAAWVVPGEGIAQAVQDLDMNAWHAMALAAQSLCDGQGAERTARALEDLMEQKDQNRDG